MDSPSQTECGPKEAKSRKQEQTVCDSTHTKFNKQNSSTVTETEQHCSLGEGTLKGRGRTEPVECWECYVMGVGVGTRVQADITVLQAEP